MFWISISSALAFPRWEGKHCGTLEQLSRAVPLIQQDERPLSVGTKSTKQERDAVCDCPNKMYSDNFVIKWGSNVSESDIEELLASFEEAWEVEVNQMGYLPPTATDQYLFNVYIGDSGSGTPYSYGAAGYFSGDEEGYPLIVIAKDTVGSDYAAMTVAHEFFHALQGRVYRYDYDETGPSAWYWEATANWVEGQVYPGVGSMAGFLIGYSFFPHYPVNYFNYPDSGSLDEYHQYGAFIFPLHLTEVEADIDVIWHSWNDQGSELDPMVVLDSYLSDYGTNINDAWINHIARMSVWDYQEGNIYQQTLAAYQNYYPEGENMIATTVRQSGTGGWRDGPADLKPMRYGHNTILATGLNDSSVTFGVRGEPQGSETSPAEWGGTVTRLRNGAIDYFPLSFTENEALLTLDNVSSSDEYYLTVGAWTESWDKNRAYTENFSYQFIIGSETEVGEPSTEPSDNLGGGSFYEKESEGIFGGCATLDSYSAWAILGAFGLIRRRRNRTVRFSHRLKR